MGALNTVLSGVKTLTQVNAVGQQAAARLQEDQENIHLSEHAEADAKARGLETESQVRMDGTQLADQQSFLYANSGVDASVGTAATVAASTRALAEKDALTVRNNAAREAWGQAKTTAQMRRQKDINLRRSGDQLNSTIIGGIADGASTAAKQ